MIPVVFNCDNKYIMPTCVVIVSILENSENKKDYEFCILVSEPISVDSIKLINRLRSIYPEIRLLYIEAHKYLKNAVTNGNHITVSTYLRLFIPQLLPQYDKCIFLDSDVIVNCNIKTLYEDTDVDNAFFAGVREYELARDISRQERKIRELDIPNMNCYAYAGVMVMNLKKFRDAGLFEKFIESIQVGYQFQDQDVLNKFCFGKIAHMPLKYNFLNRHIDSQELLDHDIYSEEEIEDTKHNEVIIHYPGKNKPWIFLQCKGGKEWWKYADIFLMEEEKEELRKEASIYAKQISWETLRTKCDNYESIVVWGFSKIGCYVFDTLRKNGYDNIIAFGDNDTEKVGKMHEGVRVLSANEIAMLEKTLIVNTSQLAYYSINHQLTLLGVKKENIFTYKHKGLTYYKSLSPHEYESELREIFYREYGDYQVFDNLGYTGALKMISEEMTSTYGLNEWLFLKLC